MNGKLAVQYGGRAGGALAAYMLVGRKAGLGGLVASVVLGWLAGGFVADKVANATMLGLDLR
jgi:hypothetical protein